MCPVELNAAVPEAVWLEGKHDCVFWSRTAAPPLPPKPSFMMPEYLTVLSSSLSSPSSQKSISKQTHPPLPTSKGKRVQSFEMFSARNHTLIQYFSCPRPGSADKGILPGNPNVVLVSLGKLLSEQRGQKTSTNVWHLCGDQLVNNDDGIIPVQATNGEPTSCTQCGSILDSAYDNMVLRLHFTSYLWKLTIAILQVNHWICLLLRRLMCATSVRTCLTLPVRCWRPQTLTVTACFCSTLTKSPSQQNLCCSSASISQVPWA